MNSKAWGAEKQYGTIAVDFDGTLCENRFPEIGEPKPLVIAYIKQQAQGGATIILHTCREDGKRPLLSEAVAFCESNGIPIHAVNETPGNPFAERYGTTGRKPFADAYIDDKAINTRRIERKGQHMRRLNWRAKFIKYALLAVCGVLLFRWGHTYATAQRGYDAIGGEMFFLALPVFWGLIGAAIKDAIATARKIKDEDDWEE